ncbi:Cilia- and flagella-associated protein 70 [Boothiomyces sp. JEL0866]|nr:Cilia- and flagella-associated protein 70 [Boothiomyces sp. JEL0866]
MSKSEDALVMTIKVLQASSLKGSRASLNSFVRIQFADFDYKDTLIEIFANKTISFSLIESLPKEKTAPLGNAEICLYNYFLKYYTQEDPEARIPECNLSISKVLPVSTNKAGGNPQDNPTISIEVTLSKPLIPTQVLQNGIFATLKPEEVYPVPEDWSLREGNEKDPNSNLYTYTMNLKIPLENEGHRVVSIPNGLLQGAEEISSTEICINAPQGIPITDMKPGDGGAGKSLNHSPSVAGDELAVPPTADRTEKEIKKIKWDSFMIVWLSPGVVARLRECAQRKFYLDIELVRSLHQKYAGATDNHSHKIKAKGSLDLGLALNPTIIGIRGRFNLELADSHGEQQGSAGTESKSKKSAHIDIYKAVGSAISLTLIFSVPLINKQRLQAITKSVHDYIPKRMVKPESQYEKRSIQAENDYKAKVNEIVLQLVNEYKHILKMESELPGNEQKILTLETQTPEDEKLRKKLFLYHLNKSGAYFSFKEQLKASVVQVVRERFKQKSPFTSQSEMQLFMSEIYVYFIEQMHVVINKIFMEKEVQKNDTQELKRLEITSLKQFAEEAERSNKTTISALYYQERIAKYEDNLSCWFDYGTFCMRNQMFSKGEECFREILSRNSKHIPALTAIAMISMASDNLEQARVFIYSALQIKPESGILNILMGIFYEMTNEELEAEKYFNAAKLNHEKGAAKPSIELAEFAIQINCAFIADRVLAQEIIQNGLNFYPYLLLSQLEIQRSNYSQAENYLKDALKIDQTNPRIWAAIGNRSLTAGNLNFIQNKFNETKIAFETVLSFIKETKDIPQLDLIYIRLGNLYLQSACKQSSSEKSLFELLYEEKVEFDENLARISKSMYLKACEVQGTCQSWLGAGQACFALKEYDQAEDAFSEANIINHRDSEVWSHLAILSLRLKRIVEANLAIAQALRLGIRDQEILKTCAMAFWENSQPRAAVELFKLAVQQSPQDIKLREMFALALKESSSIKEDKDLTNEPSIMV